MRFSSSLRVCVSIRDFGRDSFVVSTLLLEMVYLEHAHKDNAGADAHRVEDVSIQDIG
jgi:hypothetical protein